MIKLYGSILVLLIGCWSVCSGQINEQLTLSKAVQQGLAQDSAVTRAALAEIISTKGVGLAQAAYKPRLEAQLGTLYPSSSLSPTADQQPSFLGANAIWEHKALLVLTGEIDTSGRLGASLAKSEAQLNEASADTRIARLDLGLLLAQAYLDACFASEKRLLDERLLKTTQDLRTNTELRLEAGEIAAVDLTKARLQESLASDQLSQSKTLEETTRQSLFTLLTLAPDCPIALQKLASLIPSRTDVLSQDGERPVLDKIDSQEKAAEADLKLAKSELKPILNYSLRSGLITDGFGNSSFPQHLGVEGLISLSFPLFDGGSSALRQEQARLRLEQARLDRRIKERQISFEIRSARTKLVVARERMVELDSRIPEAINNLDVSYARYKAGEAQIVEVTDAQNSLTTFSQAYLGATYDYLSAELQYQRAKGEIPQL